MGTLFRFDNIEREFSEEKDILQNNFNLYYNLSIVTCEGDERI